MVTVVTVLKLAILSISVPAQKPITTAGSSHSLITTLNLEATQSLVHATNLVLLLNFHSTTYPAKRTSLIMPNLLTRILMTRRPIQLRLLIQLLL